VKNKKDELCNIIESSDPCIIIGTETWLNPTIHSSEIFPPNYEIIRKDRKDGYGGVLLAIKKDFIINNITISQENECEVAFAKLTLGKNQTLIVGAAYRPPNSDASYNERMCKAFEEISNSNKNAVIWIGGDFNLPDINWNSMAVNGNHNFLQMNNRFLEMIQNCNLDLDSSR